MVDVVKNWNFADIGIDLLPATINLEIGAAPIELW